MGFIDQEQRFRERQLIEDQARQKEYAQKEAQKALELALQKQKEKERELDRSCGSKDNAKIVELLDNLPKFNILEYLGLVEKHTGFSGRLTLYTRDEGLQKADKELKTKLAEIGIIPFNSDHSFYGTIHPREMFCGEEITPSKLLLIPILEPQEPGIGISFAKYIRERRIGPDSSSSRYIGIGYTKSYPKEDIYHHVFVRFFAPASVVIVGTGEVIRITSTKVFDDAIEEGFRHQHTRRVRGTGTTYFRPPPISFG